MDQTFHITVAGKGHYNARADDTLLEAGQRAGFGFPHACRNGNCLRCVGQLLRGSVTQRIGNQPANTRIVYADDASAGQVLYCIAHALEDCEINVPDITAPGELPVFDVSCQIIAIDDLNHDVSRIMLRLPAGRRIRWYAGQYLLLQTPAGEAAFSIANAPGGRDLELHLRHNEENSSAQEVMAALRQDTVARVQLPAGRRFIADNLPQRPVWFVCGSTGFAPAKAMIEHLLANNFDQPIRLYWGARTADDIYLPALPAQWVRDEQLEYVPVLSDSTATDEGDAGAEHAGAVYRTGLVHEAVLADLNGEQPEFHIAGSPAMAWAVFDALSAAGVPAEDMHSDVFDYAPRD